MILYIILYIYISNLIKDILDYLTFSLIYFTLFFSYPISLYLQILYSSIIDIIIKFPFISIYLPDLLLFIFIISNFMICGKLEKKTFSQFQLRKQSFYYLLHISIIFISIIIIYNFAIMDMYDEIMNPINYVLIGYDNFCFRQDFIIQFFNLLISSTTLYYMLIMKSYLIDIKSNCNGFKFPFEIPGLILLILLSLRCFIATTDLLIFVLCLEITTFSVTILLTLRITRVRSIIYNIFPIEAAIKYFVLNAISVSLLIFSIIGYYQLTTSTDLIDITNYFLFFPENKYIFSNVLIFIHLIFLFAYFIKLGAAPMHQWVPDVYEGVETLMTTLLVVVINFALNLKFLLIVKQLLFQTFIDDTNIQYLFIFIGFISVITGTINAFYQTRIKRFLAYAGITHFGFICLGLSTQDLIGYIGVLLYLFIYILTNIGIFTILLLCQKIERKPIIYISQLKNIFHSNEQLFLIFLTIILSFAGIPPFAGFFSKLFILATLINYGFYYSLFILVISIIINAYLYLRFLKIALFENHNQQFFVSVNSINSIEELKFFLIRFRTERFVDWNPSDTLPLLISCFITICLILFFLYLPIILLFLTKLAIFLLSFF